MNNQQKKVYTTDDNIRTMMFELKQIAHSVKDIQQILQAIAHSVVQQNDDKNF